MGCLPSAPRKPVSDCATEVKAPSSSIFSPGNCEAKDMVISWPTKCYRNPGVLPGTLAIGYPYPYPDGCPNSPPPFPVPDLEDMNVWVEKGYRGSGIVGSVDMTGTRWEELEGRWGR